MIWTADSIAIRADQSCWTADGNTACVAEIPAGRPRVRSIYRVTLDGQVFEFRSYAAALQFLERAKELAQEVARIALAQEKPKPLKVPEITVNTRELRSAVVETKKAIANTYKQAEIDLELRILMEIQSRTEHNEDVLLLLM